jgi:hypothetical protein
VILDHPLANGDGFAKQAFRLGRLASPQQELSKMGLVPGLIAVRAAGQHFVAELERSAQLGFGFLKSIRLQK